MKWLSENEIEQYCMDKISDAADLARIEEHLLTCKDCIRKTEEADAVIKLIKGAAEGTEAEKAPRAKHGYEMATRTKPQTGNDPHAVKSPSHRLPFLRATDQLRTLRGNLASEALLPDRSNFRGLT